MTNGAKHDGGYRTSERPYLTTTEALAYLRVSPRTLYRRLAAGDIPGLRVGHQWRFRTSDLDEWLTSQSSPATGGVQDPTAKEPGRASRILIADDEPSIRELLRAIFAPTACYFETAADGLSAVERLRVRPFDLLLTDLRMPGMDGTELAREAKRLRPDIKVVIVTGHPSQTSAIDAVNAGVDGYLTKPFHPMDVLMATARALNLGSIQERSWITLTPR